MYAVIVCYGCGRLLLTKTDQKNRQCPHCGARLIVARTKHVAHAESAREASLLMRAMKQKGKA
jgi:DNA-directed RNA polymerase subunit RPC12/RpoP